MKMKKEIKEKNNIKEKILNSIKGLTFGSYLSSTVKFVKENLLKPLGIILVLSLLFMTGLLIKPEILKMDIANVTFWANYLETIKMIIIMVVSGIAPYLYAPIIGIAYEVYLEIIYLANVILEVGYLKGMFMYMIPFILNVVIAGLSAAIGIYMCKNITLGHRITDIKATNSMDLRISIYEATNKLDKKNKLEKERKNKIKKLEGKKKELDLFQIINMTTILCVLQLIASFIKSLVI